MPKTVAANNTWIHSVFYYCLGRRKFYPIRDHPILNEADNLCNNTVYANCLLAALNARKRIQTAGSEPNDALSISM